MTKQTIKRWNERLQNPVWLRSDINAYCKLMNDVVTQDRYNNTEKSDSHKIAVETVFIEDCGSVKRITKEQSDFGIKWLKQYAFKKNGEPRQQKGNPLRNFEREVIRNFSHFEFRGAYDQGSNGWGAHRPIYRTYAKDGSYFDYVPGSWGAWDIELV